MKLIKAAAAALLGLAFVSAFAETVQEAAVRKAIEPRLGDDAKVVSVSKRLIPAYLKCK